MRFIHQAVSVLWTLAVLPTCKAVSASESQSEEQKKQDVFLACLNALSHADENLDNRITKHEYKLFLKYFSNHLYTNPVLDDGPLPDTIKELFDDLVAASGVDASDYYSGEMDVLGSKVDDMPKVGTERFEELHAVCDLTVEGLKEQAAKTAAPQVVVLEFTLAQQPDDSEDGLHVRIKQFEKDMENQAALQGVMTTEIEEGDALLEDGVEEQGLLEGDNSTTLITSSTIVDESQGTSASSSSDSGDGWSQDDTMISEKSIAKAKAKAAKREKQEQVNSSSSSQSEDEKLAIAKANAMKREEQDSSDSEDEEIELDDASSQSKDSSTSSGKKRNQKKQKHSIRGANATASSSSSFEDESLSLDQIEGTATELDSIASDSESVEDGAMSGEKKHHKPKEKKAQKAAVVTSSEDLSDSADESEDYISESKPDGSSKTVKSEMAFREDSADSPDSSDDSSDEQISKDSSVSLDEDGPDVQVLSIHSSFVISNVDGITAKDVDTSPTGNLQKAYKQFLHDMLSAVCDKAGEHYKHCGGEGDVKPHAASKIKFDEASSSSDDYEKSWDAIVDEKEEAKQQNKISTKKAKVSAKQAKKKPSTEKKEEDKTKGSEDEKMNSWDAVVDPKHKNEKGLNATTEATNATDTQTDSKDEVGNDFGIEEDDLVLEVDEGHGNTTANISLGHQQAAADSQDMLELMADDEDILANHTNKVAEAFRGKDGKEKVEGTVQDLLDREEITEDEADSMLSAFEDSNYTAAPNATTFNQTTSETKAVKDVEEEYEKDAAESNGLLSFMSGKEEAEEEEETPDSSKSDVRDVEEEYEEDEAANNGLLSFMFGEEETGDDDSSGTEVSDVEEEYEEDEAASNSLLGFMFGQEEAAEDEEEAETEAPKKEKSAVKPDAGRGKQTGSNRRRTAESLAPVSGVSVLDVELYEIRDTDCPMDYADTGDARLCQTIYAHYDLLILNLDGNVEEIEDNYMFVTETATNEGLLEKSLEAVKPTSAYTVEEAGARPFPGSKHKNTASAESTRMNFNDVWREVDPELDSLLTTGGYAKQHQAEMLEAEDGYDEQIISQYDRVQPRGQFSAATSIGHCFTVLALNLLAYIMVQLID